MLLSGVKVVFSDALCTYACMLACRREIWLCLSTDTQFLRHFRTLRISVPWEPGGTAKIGTS